MRAKDAMEILRSRVAPLLLLAFAALHPAQLQAQFDPERAYRQSEEVRQRYADPPVVYDTPGLAPGRKDFTSHAEMMAFVEGLRRRSGAVQVRMIGASQEGRAIPAMVLSGSGETDAAELRRLGRPVVMMAGLQHGNEPAGGEAMLVLAQELATGSLRPLLDKLTVVIVPHSNPDGAHYFRRSPYSTIDINRDHVKMDLPETRALHRMVNEFAPHLFIDAHEFSVANRWIQKFGTIQSYDLLVQYATNPNVHPTLTTLADGKFLAALRGDVERAGHTHFWYYTTSYNLKNLRVSMGGTTPDIGRNFAGLQNAVSFLVESRGVGIGREGFARRVQTHVVAIGSLLNTAAANARELIDTVESARADIVRRGRDPQPGDMVAVTVKTPVVRQKLMMLDPQSGVLKEIEVDWSDSLKATAGIARARPWAYVMPPVFHQVAERLRLSGVEVRRLGEPVQLEVESYTVTDRKPSATYVEGRITSRVATEVAAKKVWFPAGSYVYLMAQPNANVITVALEPESPSSFVSFGLIPVDRKGSPPTGAASSEVPVYRVLRPAELDLRRVEPRRPE
ncbi:MAG: M14 family metallopeptidase [Burkholderiales bacterium]